MNLENWLKEELGESPTINKDALRIASNIDAAVNLASTETNLIRPELCIIGGKLNLDWVDEGIGLRVNLTFKF